MAADRTPNELADVLEGSQNSYIAMMADGHRSIIVRSKDDELAECYQLMAEAAVLLRRQGEQLDIQTALATNYAGKAVEYKQEKERAEEQLDTLRKQYEWCAGLLGTHDHTGSDHMEDAAREAERAERAEAQLDTLRNAIDARMLDCWTPITTGATGDVSELSEAPCGDCPGCTLANTFDALAAAGGGVPETATCPTCNGRKDDGKGAQVVEVSGREVLAILKCPDCDGTGIAAGGGVSEEGATDE